MKKLIGALAGIALATSGCVVPDCVIGNTYWYIENDATCQDAMDDMARLKSTFMETGVLNEWQYDDAIKGMNVTILDEDIFEENLTGKYTLTNDTVYIGRRRLALAHEILHRWDSIHLAIGTTWHEDWCNNGYYLLDMKYGERTAWSRSGLNGEWNGVHSFNWKCNWNPNGPEEN